MAAGADNEEGWWEIDVDCPVEGVEALSGFMFDLGAEGVVTDSRLLYGPGAQDPMLDTRRQVVGYWSRESEGDELLAAVEGFCERSARFFPSFCGARVRLKALAQTDWTKAWQRHFGVLHLEGGVVVKPPWEDYRPGPDEILVEIEPGTAFGTGHHATTRHCMAVIRQYARERGASPGSMLDVGSGSGILSILAAKLGFAPIVGVEVDTKALASARGNLVLNGVESLVRFTDDPVRNLEGRFDLVAANILAEVVVHLRDQIAGAAAPGGTVVLSGILDDREVNVARAYGEGGLGWEQCNRLTEGCWVTLVYRAGGD